MANLTKAGETAKKEMMDQAEMLDTEQLSDTYATVKEELERMEGRLEALKEVQLGRMLESGEEQVQCSSGSWSFQQGRVTTSVNPRKLLEKGVDPDIIEECTETRTGSPFVVFRHSRSNGDKS